MGFQASAMPRMNKLNLKMKNLLALSIAAVLSLCSVHADTITLNSSGSTFIAPINGRWFAEYNKLHPDVHINYQSVRQRRRASSRSLTA